MQNENPKTTIGEKINNFIQRYKRIIIVTSISIAVLFAGLIVFLTLQDMFNKRAIAELEELSRRHDELMINAGGNYFTSDFDTLLADLNAFSKNKRGYAGGKSLSIIGLIHSVRNEWPQAETAWLSSARAGNRTYIAPMSLFNAAAAAEEQGKLEQAIELLQRSINHPFEFPAAPRAQFSIGRLYEQLNNYPAAVEAYRAVLIHWQEIPVWQDLARSRIAAIEVR